MKLTWWEYFLIATGTTLFLFPVMLIILSEIYLHFPWGSRRLERLIVRRWVRLKRRCGCGRRGGRNTSHAPSDVPGDRPGDIPLTQRASRSTHGQEVFEPYASQLLEEPEPRVIAAASVRPQPPNRLQPFALAHLPSVPEILNFDRTERNPITREGLGRPPAVRTRLGDMETLRPFTSRQVTRRPIHASGIRRKQRWYSHLRLGRRKGVG